MCDLKISVGTAGETDEQLGDEVKVIGTCVVEILTLLGILNNPSDCSKF